MKNTFESKFVQLNSVTLPDFSNTRVMMLPLELGDIIGTLPDNLSHYSSTLTQLIDLSPCKYGVGYLTIDEKEVNVGQTHRRSGLHVDGIYQGKNGGWGGGGGWGSNGMLTVSNVVGCQAWKQTFEGWPSLEGECDHLKEQCKESTVFQANYVYWLDGMCVHESLPQPTSVQRQFVRLSMPSNSPWFEGYTENPKGIKPTGPIFPRRHFMDL